MTTEKGPYYRPSSEELPKPLVRKFLIDKKNIDQITREKDNFFNSVLEVLGMESVDDMVKTEEMELYKLDENENPVLTGNIITLLIVKGSAVASILEQQQDSFNIKISAASYLTPETVQGLGKKFSKK